MSETRTIVTKVEKVFDAKPTGWIDIKLGNDWRVSTKKPGIANQGRNFEGRVAAVDYIEFESGQYTNRWAQAFREPAADEVNGTGTDAVGASVPSWAEDPVPPGQAVFTPNNLATPPTQDEFRRSKEEMRWTEALHIAGLLMASTPNASTTAVAVLADEIYGIIERGRV